MGTSRGAIYLPISKLYVLTSCHVLMSPAWVYISHLGRVRQSVTRCALLSE